jgi:putative N6-adenine-specific DNA methylase
MMKMIAKTFQGMEEILAEDLQDLGAKQIRLIKRGVSFEGDKRLLYRVNLECRTALRVLVPLYSFRARQEEIFYNKIREIDWSEFMNVEQTLAIDSVVHSAFFKHSQYIGLKTKDAICDQFREKLGKRPNVNTMNPDLRINVHINGDQVDVSLDASGDSLHKRGYRVDTIEAPINEVLAAGMVRLSGWQCDTDFMDAMCGSGTILTEASLLAHNIPANEGRDYFCFKYWRDFDDELWANVVVTANENKKEFDHKIMGSDNSFQSIRVSERNLEAAGLTDMIDLRRKAFEKLEPMGGRGLLMMNPPYDERMKMEDINLFYEMMGDTIKRSFKGWEAWIISSNMNALKAIGIKPAEKIELFNGPLECSLQKFII